MSVKTQIDRISNEVESQENLINQIRNVVYTKSSVNGTPETWTFTLEDDSTVEKVVYVE